jgi:hypothetical protein
MKDPAKPIEFTAANNMECNPTNFDDATKQDMGVNLLQQQMFGGIGALPGTMYKPDAFKTGGYNGGSGLGMLAVNERVTRVESVDDGDWD